MTDPHAPELIYVYHEGLDRYAWIPKSAQYQHGLQGWIAADPPEPPARNVDGTLAAEQPQTPNPTSGDAETESRTSDSETTEEN